MAAFASDAMHFSDPGRVDLTLIEDSLQSLDGGGIPINSHQYLQITNAIDRTLRFGPRSAAARTTSLRPAVEDEEFGYERFSCRPFAVAHPDSARGPRSRRRRHAFADA